MTDLQGQVLAGRYELDRVLGAGGMATVYLAADNLLERQVAVKVLDRSQARDPAVVERFRVEARTAAGLSHPNIVAVFDSGSDGELHYLVMEYVPGPSLAQLLRRSGPLPPRRAAELAGQVCAALQAAHVQGVVHRDVKPGNVLLGGDGRVKVTDFGIAKTAAASTLTADGVVLGTAAYLSPEQAQGRPADARSDVYALGCLLHELLTGAPPFGSGADHPPVAVAMRHVSEPPEPPSRRNPRVDPGLDAVVLTAMAKHPDQRQQSARAMRGELARVLAGHATTARYAAVPAGRRRRRPPTLAGAARPSWGLRALLVGIVVAVVVALSPNVLGGPEQPAEATPTSPPAPTSPSTTTAPPQAEHAGGGARGGQRDQAVRQRPPDRAAATTPGREAAEGGKKDNGKKKGKEPARVGSVLP